MILDPSTRCFSPSERITAYPYKAPAVSVSFERHSANIGFGAVFIKIGKDLYVFFSESKRKCMSGLKSVLLKISDAQSASLYPQPGQRGRIFGHDIEIIPEHFKSVFGSKYLLRSFLT